MGIISAWGAGTIHRTCPNMKLVRRRMQARLQKAVRNAEHGNPGCAKVVSRLGRAGLPVHRALNRIVADSNCELKLRAFAARLLRDIGRDTFAFVPLLAEFIAAGDPKVTDLWDTVRWMSHRRHRLTRREFEMLHSVLRTGTPEQRYWVVDQIAFFRGGRVRRALIEVLDDVTVPAYVRAWAAERLQVARISQDTVSACLRAIDDSDPEIRLWCVSRSHDFTVPAYVRAWAAERLQVARISQDTVSACLRAIDDSDPEIRLWCVSTLGVAASYHLSFRDAVLPVIERMQSDDGEVPGWWPVRREAQEWVASLRGSPDDEERLQAEVQAILNDPGASKEDKFWASGQDRSS